MIDTTRVKFPISPTEEQLKNWTRRITTSPTGQRESYIYNPIIDGTMLRFTYYPLGYDNKPLLTLEVSLPKLLFDNNYKMINSIDGSVKVANLILDSIPHIPKLDIGQGILIRLDMCYNHQVGDAVEDYIKAIGNLEYPHRRTKHHRHEGVEFRAKHKTTKFYNKERESGFPETFGILRQETTLINSKDIQKFLGKKQPTLFDISFEQVSNYLSDDLQKLGLLNNSIANQNTALKALCDQFGQDAGFYYFGLLMSKLDKPRKRIAKESKTHPRSLDRKLRKILEVNIALTLTDREEPLPPLKINNE